MIKPVSEMNGSEVTNKGPKKIFPQRKIDENSPYAIRYADSFVKHTVDSAPVLGALTVFWSFVDKSRFASMKKSLNYNVKNFFLPVLIITSAITSFIDNKKPKAEK